jgi:putative transcriptional regulator
MSKVGERLIASAKEARAIAKGQLAPAGVYVPPDVDVKAIRRKLETSQEDFAAAFGFSINQVRDWEQGRSRPTGGVRAYLMIIREEPNLVRDLLRRTKKAA